MKYILLITLILGGCVSNTPPPVNSPIPLQNYDEEVLKAKAKALNMRYVDYLHALTNNKIPELRNQNPKYNGAVSPNGSFTPKYEVRLLNQEQDEVLFVTPTLDDAKSYIEEYKMFHSDIFIYEKETGEVVHTNTP